MKKYTFGVDIGGTTVKIGLFKTSGELFDVWEIPTRTIENGIYILSDIAKQIEEKITENGIDKMEIEGIGMGVPGPVDENGQVLGCVNLGWDVFNVDEEMTKLTGLKAKAGNDANIAALGEMWKGGGNGYKNLVMVTLGTGVGGGIILNGKILSGVHGAAGEIGHISMSDKEEQCCGCGNKGCLEQYASANGIIKITKRYLEEHTEKESSLRNIKSYTSKEIFEEAKKGDEVSLCMVDEVGKLLGKALASIATVIDPEVFVLGGGMSKAGDMLLEAIKKYYIHYAFHATRNVAFKFATLGNHAGIYGAAKLVIA